jgi:hypothetical protein
MSYLVSLRLLVGRNFSIGVFVSLFWFALPAWCGDEVSSKEQGVARLSVPVSQLVLKNGPLESAFIPESQRGGFFTGQPREDRAQRCWGRPETFGSYLSRTISYYHEWNALIREGEGWGVDLANPPSRNSSDHSYKMDIALKGKTSDEIVGRLLQADFEYKQKIRSEGLLLNGFIYGILRRKAFEKIDQLESQLRTLSGSDALKVQLIRQMRGIKRFLQLREESGARLDHVLMGKFTDSLSLQTLKEAESPEDLGLLRAELLEKKAQLQILLDQESQDLQKEKARKQLVLCEDLIQWADVRIGNWQQFVQEQLEEKVTQVMRDALEQTMAQGFGGASLTGSLRSIYNDAHRNEQYPQWKEFIVSEVKQLLGQAADLAGSLQGEKRAAIEQQAEGFRGFLEFLEIQQAQFKTVALKQAKEGVRRARVMSSVDLKQTVAQEQLEALLEKPAEGIKVAEWRQIVFDEMRQVVGEISEKLDRFQIKNPEVRKKAQFQVKVLSEFLQKVDQTTP